jgi:hypothetical protein
MTDSGRELPRRKAIQIKLGWEFGMRYFTVSSAWFQGKIFTGKNRACPCSRTKAFQGGEL